MASVEKLITENIDIWSNAIKPKAATGRGRGKSNNSKYELYGIKKLRELILELAVRGLLVPQDPNDEPAEELLNNLNSEHAKLVHEGLIRKRRKLPNLSLNKVEKKLPDQWALVRLADIALVDMGNSPPGDTYNETGNGVPLINGPVEFSKHHFGKTLKVKFTTAPNIMCDEGDILVCVRGATTGRTNIAAFPACIGRGVARVRSLGYQEFVNLLMWENQYRLLAKGTGTTFPSISYVDLAGHMVMLPPLKEQHRIVAKVDELMALCDQLEQQTEASLTAHQTLVETVLAALITGDGGHAGDELNASILFFEHFDTLFTTEQSVDQLKQTILQLATSGKLISFPDGTKRGMLKDYLSFGPRNGLSPKECAYETPYKVLKLGATSYGTLNLEQTKNVDLNVEEKSHLWLKAGDILVQRGNSHIFVGSNVLIEQNVENVIYPDLMMKLRVTSEVIPSYVSLWLKSPLIRKFMWDRMTGTSGTMPKISKKIVESIPLSVPPIDVQTKVVEHVSLLLDLCDQLKQRLTDSKTTQLHLADAMAEQAVG